MTNNDRLAQHLLSLVIATSENNIPGMTGILNRERDLFRETVEKSGMGMNNFYTLLLNKAVEHDAADAVRFLADLGANVNGQATKGTGTFLDLAAASKSLNAALALIEKGADPETAKADSKAVLRQVGNVLVISTHRARQDVNKKNTNFKLK